MKVEELAKCIYSELNGIDINDLTKAEKNILHIIKPFLKRKLK
jgi:hypothetical protein